MSRRTESGADAGLSLVEVIMAMLVMSFLGLAVVATVSSVARSSTAATNRLLATTRAQTLSDRLSKDLRAAHLMNTTPATAFDYAGANQVTFYTDAGDATGPRRVNVVVAPLTPQATMTETTTLADAGGTGGNYTYTGPGTSRVVGPADVDGSGVLFSYYDGNNALIPTASLPLVTPAQTAGISRVVISLKVQEKGLGAISNVVSSVYLRNVEYR